MPKTRHTRKSATKAAPAVMRDSAFVADVHTVRTEWKAFLLNASEKPYTLWDASLETDPDGFVRLKFRRRFRHDYSESFHLAADMTLDEVRALSHMLAAMVDRIERRTMAQLWQELHK